jgi:hypothetical protein
MLGEDSDDGVVLLLVGLLVVVLLLLVALKQRSRHKNWANDAAYPRKHEIFVLSVLILQYIRIRKICIQSLHAVLDCIASWYELVCSGVNWMLLKIRIGLCYVWCVFACIV